MTTFRNENARLARARTYEWIADGAIERLADGPRKRELRSRFYSATDELRRREREARQ
jgi:hypothetical protein